MYLHGGQPLKLPLEAFAHFKNTTGFDAAAFAAAHSSGFPISIRHNLIKGKGIDVSMPIVPWCTHAHYLHQRPLFQRDPLWHAGAYYVQEASSMFLDFLCRKLFDPGLPLVVLDACASPGGKSTLLTDALPAQSLLVSNEVISKRAGILFENIEKWGRVSTMVTQADVKQFSRLPFGFDVILVDAPCTGSGLWRKDAASIDEWSISAIEACVARQKQIITDLWPSLKPGGVLIYCTCSYSKNENEDILDYIRNEFDVEPLDIELHSGWGVTRSFSAKYSLPCFRFYPYNVQGEGFFIGAIQKTGGEFQYPTPSYQNKARKISKANLPVANLPDDVLVYEFEPKRYRAWPSQWQDEMQLIAETIGAKRAGVVIGEIKGKDFIPAHDFAMSELLQGNFAPFYQLDETEALPYLRKDTQWFDKMPNGWNIVAYQGTALGWAKKSANRINNCYPPAWRLRN